MSAKWFKFVGGLYRSSSAYAAVFVLLSVSLILMSLSEHPNIKNLRAFSFNVFAVFASAGNHITSVFGTNKEIEELKKENAELMLEVSRLRKLGIENEELKGMLSIKDSSSYSLVASTILARSVSPSEYNLIINRGKDDGVSVGMPVINDLGLVGVVYNVAGDHAIVHTLKNTRLKLITRLEETGVTGVLRWDGNRLILPNLPKTADIKPGERLLTSENSSIINVPIPIGYVIRVLNPESGLFNQLQIKPYVNLDRLDHIYVVKKVFGKEINGIELNYLKSE
ncbi:MAG: rod shape-determining protein MreC [Ignavibacteriaceae bacterium]|nr:rod shape-determining protein MreC [Ignavibacteriaceae bacterium]